MFLPKLTQVNELSRYKSSTEMIKILPKILFQFLFLVFLAFMSAGVHAQQCKTILDGSQENLMNASREQREEIAFNSYNGQGIPVPLQFHVMQRNDGSGNVDFDDLIGIVEAGSDFFQDSGLILEECSKVHLIYDSFFFNNSIDANSQELLDVITDNNIPGVINIYIIPESNTCGWSSFPGKKPVDYLVINDLCLGEGSEIAHQLGHYFSLYHTHETAGGVFELPDASNCGPNSGDEICDTPADPNLYGLVSFDCNYQNGLSDEIPSLPTGFQLNDYLPATDNIMSFATENCRGSFTDEQLKRIYHSYIWDRSYLYNLNGDNVCDGVQNGTFNSLLENWEILTSNNAQIDSHFSSDYLYTAIQEGGASRNDILLQQKSISLRPSASYSLNFVSFSSFQALIKIEIKDSHSNVVLFSSEETIPSNWTNFKFTFENDALLNEVDLDLYYGDNVGAVSFDDFRLIDLNCAPSAESHCSLLSNGEFKKRGSNWFTSEEGSADVYWQADSSYASTVIVNSGTALKDVRFSQMGFSIESGKNYEIEFEARAEAARQIEVAVVSATGSIVPVFEEIINLSTQWNTYTLAFHAFESLETARLDFAIGAENLDCEFDNVSLIDLQCGEKCSLVRGGGFEENDNQFWSNWTFTEGVVATQSYHDGLLEIDMIEGGWLSEHVQIRQNDIYLAKDSLYVLSFRAKADSPRSASVLFEQANFSNACFDESIQLNSSWQDFTFSFFANCQSVRKNLVFNIGGSSGVVSIDDILLVGACASAATGIEESEDGNNLQLYPNPCQDFLNIELEQVFNSNAKSSIAIYGLNGELLSHQEINEQVSSSQIPTNDLQTGMYILEVITGDVRINRRFVKM